MNLKDYTLISAASNKAVSLRDFNNDALWKDTTWDTRALRNKQADIGKASNFRDLIGVIYRCIDIRSATVASIPFNVFKGDRIVYNSAVATDDTKYPWIEAIQHLLSLTESSLLLSSEAFWLKDFAMAGNMLGLRWLASPFITPVYSESDGIVGFKRVVGNNTETYKRDAIAYFFVQDPMTELLPDIPQVLAAANSASVILNYEDFVSKFYERGAVKATILKVDRSTPPKERARLKDFWQSFMTGNKNSYTTEVVSGDVEAEVIGEGAGDSEKTEVLTSRRKDIATAMGVPYSLLFGDTSSSYTAGPTETKNFLNFTIIPRAKLIQRALNAQVFKPLGLSFKFLTDNLPAFKDASEIESKIFTAYTGALIPHSIAAQLAGIALPEGTSYADLDAMVAKERERLFTEKERIVTLNSKIGQEGGGNQEKLVDPDKMDNNIRNADDGRSEEVRKYKKWLKNRKNDEIDPYSFVSIVLDDADKVEIYKSFVEENGGSNDNRPFSLSDYPNIKAVVTIGSLDNETPSELLDLEVEHESALADAFNSQIDSSFPSGEDISADEFFQEFRNTFDANSSALYDSILVMMLAYASFGVASATSKVLRYVPNFDSQDSYYQARQFATTRADDAFRLIQEATLRRAEAIFQEYKRGNNLGLAWVVSELKKFVNEERARVISTNESMNVVRAAEKMVYQNSGVVKLVRWATAMDERVCPICGPRHGRVYPLIAAPLAPAHIRCRCALLPMVDTNVGVGALFGG